MIYPVPLSHIDTVWPRVGPFLQKALDKTHNDCFTVNDLRMSCKNGNMICWMAVEEDEILGTALTEIILYPRKKVLNVPFVGGEQMIKWGEPMLNELEEYAKSIGADSLTGGGRKGWKIMGFEQIGVVLEKRL